jgi:hypothetical protein
MHNLKLLKDIQEEGGLFGKKLRGEREQGRAERCDIIKVFIYMYETVTMKSIFCIVNMHK